QPSPCPEGPWRERPEPGRQPAGLNVIYTALLATCYYAVKAVIDPNILPNAGLSRPITVEAPYGSILNCKHPAAVDGRIA
ncbi:hydantoinase B/oxoprolinase family protein, partial [Rhizobium ruizarguesonis]